MTGVQTCALPIWEPTDLYLAVMRVMGTFLLIFSVGFLGYAIYTLVTG